MPLQWIAGELAVVIVSHYVNNWQELMDTVVSCVGFER